MLKFSCLVAFLLLTGCAAPRLQHPYEAANEVSKTNQANMEARCGAAGPQAMDCKRRTREEFESLRKNNEQTLR